MASYLTVSNLLNLLKLVLDIGVVAIIIYYILKVIRNNRRTMQIFKGILFILIFNGIAQLLGLKTIEYLSSQILNWGILAFVIIFQPEIRALLEKVGRISFMQGTNSLSEESKEKLMNELLKTAISLSKTKTGALITIEQNQSLNDYIKTGTAMDSVVSSELLGSIFQYGTPLHDGAVIIRGDKIACASAYFPPTSKEFPSSYGARHRAAVGISEVTDSVTIVVSEETGNVSIAKNGNLTVMNENELRDYLSILILQKPSKVEEEKKEEKPVKRSRKTTKKTQEKPVQKKKTNKKKSGPIDAIEIVVNNADTSKEGSDDE